MLTHRVLKVVSVHTAAIRGKSRQCTTTKEEVWNPFMVAKGNGKVCGFREKSMLNLQTEERMSQK